MAILRLGELFPGVLYHVARRTFTAGERLADHGHDFCEVFWLEKGALEHRVNGEDQRLSRGDAAFIRPGDVHGCDLVAGSDCTIVNFALPAEAAWSAEQRYGMACWPRGPAVPSCVRGLDGRRLERLARMAAVMPSGFREARHRDMLLLCVYEQVADLMAGSTAADGPGRPVAAMPDWLRQATSAITEQELAEGADALVRRAGRSREHVSREMARHVGRSTTRWINDRRLELAARALRLSDRPILEVALDCGFDNLSYFYRLFAQRYGQSPRRYRLAHGVLVG